MPRPLRFRPTFLRPAALRPAALRSAALRSAALRSAALLAASAAAGPAFAQAFPPGAGGDPLAAGAFAVPTAGPVAVAYGDPAAISGGTVISAPADAAMISGPTPSGGPVYMAPQVVGSPQMMGAPMMSGAPMMGSPMPGSPGCNCGPGGASMFGSPAMGAPMGMPMTGMPMAAPAYGAPMETFGGSDGCCLTGGFDGSCGAPICDPCQATPPVCDPCGGFGAGAYGGGGDGLYHSMGGKPRCGWSAGFSWVFLKPFYSSNEAFTVSNGGGFGSTETQGFSHSLDLSPRVFVEWVSKSDWGIRATWFGYENEADTETTVVPAGGFGFNPFGQTAQPGQTISAVSEFDVDTIDFDFTQRFSVRKSLINIGGGVRWMGYEHNYRSAIDSFTTDASRQFDGAGPTVFAEWRRPIGASRFSLLASVRGALLYGQSETDTTINGFNGVPGLVSVSQSEADDFVATGEAQLGGEWSAWVGERTVLFVQLAYEAQALLGVGTALDANDDIGLHGFNTKVGFEW